MVVVQRFLDALARNRDVVLFAGERQDIDQQREARAHRLTWMLQCERGIDATDQRPGLIVSRGASLASHL